MSEREAQDDPVSVADEAGSVFDDALARQESKPLNGRATPQQVGYFEAGFTAGAEWRASRKVEVTEHKITQRIPWPPSPESRYMLSLFECSCRWTTDTFIDLHENRKTIDALRKYAENHAALGGETNE